MPSGATYAPPGAYQAPPSSAQRIGRGIGWGILYAQVWTIYRAVGLLIFGGLAAATSTNGQDATIIGLGIGVVLVLFALFHAVMGAVAGLLIGATNATEDSASVIGVVASLLMVGAQYLVGLRAGVGLIIGLFIAVSFGKYMGSNIAKKVHGNSW
jgi:hypothetical protein